MLKVHKTKCAKDYVICHTAHNHELITGMLMNNITQHIIMNINHRDVNEKCHTAHNHDHNQHIIFNNINNS